MSTQAAKAFEDIPTPPGSWVPYVGKCQLSLNQVQAINDTGFRRKHCPIGQKTRRIWKNVDEP